VRPSVTKACDAESVAKEMPCLCFKSFVTQGARAKFGAVTPFKVSLAGAPDLAASWLYGDDAQVPWPCHHPSETCLVCRDPLE